MKISGSNILLVIIVGLLLLIGLVSADSSYCTPPSGQTVTIDHNGNWYNITITSDTCFEWYDAGDGQVVGYPCAPTTFTSNVTCGIVPFDVQFTDITETSGETAWYWMFGDGDTSTMQNPTHNYNDTGVYGINFSMTAPSGTRWSNVTNYITARPIGDTCAGGTGGNAYDTDKYTPNWFTGWVV